MVPSRQYRVAEELDQHNNSDDPTNPAAALPPSVKKLHAIMQREFAAMSAGELEREIPLSLYSGQRERPPANHFEEPVVDIDEFLVQGGYLPTLAEREARATRLRVRELRERERQEKGLSNGGPTGGGGTMTYRPRTVRNNSDSEEEWMIH